MATAEQIKSLIKAYVEKNDDRFKTVSLQIAAHEAKIGHDGLARDIKKEIDKIGSRRASITQINQINPMLFFTSPTNRLSELVVTSGVEEKIRRILNEYRNRNKLYAYGMRNRRRVLIEGAPGTGKTLTASIIASELSLPLYTIQMDKIVTKFMGETSSRLRQIFETIEKNTGVYFFDEFDAIGANRDLDNEVGEMRRILNSFLQFLEQDISESIIIAATNNQKLLDPALFRRFDDVLHYSLPTEQEILRLFEMKLNCLDYDYCISERIIEAAEGLSQAEIVKACDDAIKKSILSSLQITEQEMIDFLKERHDVYLSKGA